MNSSHRFGWIATLAACLSMLVAMQPSAQAADKPKDKKAQKITYKDHILPIFRNRCLGCHNTDKAKADLDLSLYSEMMIGGAGGEVVKAGDPSSSPVYLTVSHLAEPKMPPGGAKIPAEEIALIKKWIEGGLLETASSKAVKPKTNDISIDLSKVTMGKPDGPAAMPVEISLKPVLHTQRANAVTALASSPWAPLVAIAGHKQVILINSDTLERLGVLAFPEGNINVLKFSRNGSWLMAAGGRGAHSGKVILFDVKTGKRVAEVGNEFDEVLAADISSNQKWVALGGSNKLVKIYSVETGKVIHSIKKHTDWVTAVEFSHDSVLLTTGDRSGGLHVWEAKTGQPFFTLDGHKGAITGISWRADSNVCATSAEDGQVALWSLQEGKREKNWNASGGGAMGVTFTHDGKLCTTGRDRVSRIFDATAKKLKDLGGLADIGLSVTFSHDGKRVFAGDWTGMVYAWDSESGKLVGKISSNPLPIAEELQRLRDSYNQQKAAFDKAANDLANWEKIVDGKKKGLTNHIARIKKAETDYNKARQDQGKFKLARDRANQKVKDLTRQLQKQQRTVQGHDKNFKKYDGELKKVRAQHKAVADKIPAATKARDDAQNAVNALTGELKNKPDDKALAERLKKAQDELNKKNTELTNLNNQLKDWAGKVTNAEKQYNDEKGKLAAEKKKYDDANKELANQRKLAVDNNNNYNNARKSESDNKKLIPNLKKATPNIQKDLQNWEKKVADQRKLVAPLQEAATKAKDTVDRWAAKVNNTPQSAQAPANQPKKS